MRKLVCLFVCLVCVAVAKGQQAGGEDERYGFLEEDFREIQSDISLFYLELGDRTGIFDGMSQYDFNFTQYRYRGYPERFRRRYLGRLDVSSLNAKYPDYTFYSALREAYPQKQETAGSGFPSIGVGSVGGAEEFFMLPSERREGHSIMANYSERRYRTALKVISSADMGKGWRYAFSARRKWGRDAFVEGVFTDALTVSFGVERLFRDKSRIALFAIGSPYEQSTKAWVVPEVTELTGNKYYNPSWGYYDGGKRGSKVNSGFTPMIAASYDLAPIGGHELNLSVGYRFGERVRTGLTWYDAANPAPDYYMNLPSHFADWELAEEVESSWRRLDPGYTQVDWNRMWMTNLLGGGAAVYALDERVERVNNLQLAFTGRSPQDKPLAYTYGLRIKDDRTNYYKRLKDLLGATYLTDLDQYYDRDGFMQGKYLNDVRNSGKQVNPGEVFGYDYDMRRSEASAHGALAYREGRWQLYAGAELILSRLQRNGHFERERFPGNESFGKSDKYDFTSYNVKIAASYGVSTNHRISALLYAGELEPVAENFFYSPEAANMVDSHSENTRILSAELKYTGTVFPFMVFELAGYFSQTSGETELYRYYDDITYESSVMSLNGVSKQSAGAEVGVKIDITSRLKLLAGGSFNSYIYTNDPDMTIRADFDLRPTLTDGKAYINGFIHSTSPQTVLSASLTYSTPKGFRVELSYAFADRRYVSINPLRRTNRVIALAASPEARDLFYRQEKLPAASSVNFYISQRFKIRGCTLFASVSVNNLLDTETIYGGYEQMRIRRNGDSYVPFDSRYSYGYPRTIYATLSFNF